MGEIITLSGSLRDELNFNLRSLLGENCSLAAAISIENASSYVYDCLVLQEHRGEKGTGIISVDEGEFHHAKKSGRASDVFHGFEFERDLPGKTAMGHGRYPTCGDDDSPTNIQPLFFHNSRYGPFMIAHNGTLAGASEERKRMLRAGVLFQSTTDTELFGHLIAQSNKKNMEDAIVDATKRVEAAYSFLILTQDKLFALRDKFGVRPLSIGKIDGGYLVCSETYAFDQYDECEFIRDVNPGEMVVFERDVPHFRSMNYVEPNENFCVFESIYFSNPRTRYGGFFNEDFRKELGRELYNENNKLDVDVVVPILDSGKHAAEGFCEASGVPYTEAFLRVHNAPRINRRSFTSTNVEERIRTARKKAHLREDKVKGMVVATMDDSIVRSNTTMVVNERLRKAGVSSIVNLIASPPIKSICPFGMDFQTFDQLIAHRRSVEEIRDRVGADELIYLTENGLDEVVKRTYNRGTCRGCFTGNYPTDINGN